jgi:hypothetical protein
MGNHQVPVGLVDKAATRLVGWLADDACLDRAPLAL